MRISTIPTSIIIIVILCALAPLDWAEVSAQEDPVATLEPYQGGISLLSEDNILEITEPTLVTAGQVIQTDETGWGLVTFFDGATLELLPETEVEILELSVPDTENNSFSISIEQLAGNTFSTITAVVDSESIYEIQTPNVTLSVRGTRFYTRVTHGTQKTQVSSLEGTVAGRVEDSDEEVLIEKDHTGHFNQDAPQIENVIVIPPRPNDSRAEDLTLIPDVPTTGGVEVYPQPDRASGRLFAALTDFQPYVGGVSEDGEWLLIYYFDDEGVKSGWVPTEQLEINDNSIQRLTTVPPNTEVDPPQLPIDRSEADDFQPGTGTNTPLEESREGSDNEDESFERDSGLVDDTDNSEAQDGVEDTSRDREGTSSTNTETRDSSREGNTGPTSDDSSSTEDR